MSVLFCAGGANAARSVSLLTELPQAPTSATAGSTPSPLAPPPGALAPAVAPFTSSAAAPDAKPVQVKSEARAVTPPPASHADTDMGVKAEEEQQQQTGAAPSLISAVPTQTGVNPNAPPQLPPMQSMLEDGHVFMPQMPADLQAELASSASSSFNGIVTFSTMQQQLSSTFDGSPLLAGDFAADLFLSPAFAVTDVVDDDSNGVADAAVASNVGAGSPIIDIAPFNAATGESSSHSIYQQQQHAHMHAALHSS